MREKIEKWEADIAEYRRKKEETCRRYNEKIEEMKKKIAEAHREQKRQEDKLLGDAFRQIVGDLTQEQICDIISRFEREEGAGSENKTE